MINNRKAVIRSKEKETKPLLKRDNQKLFLYKNLSPKYNLHLPIKYRLRRDNPK
jgi:hypothetical protein